MIWILVEFLPYLSQNLNLGLGLDSIQILILIKN